MRGIYLKKRFYMPQKCGFESTACNLHQTPKPSVRRQLLLPIASVTRPCLTRKAFKEGDIVKEAFIEAADSLFEDFNNKTQIVKAIKKGNSPQTSKMQCVGMAGYVEEQLRKVIDACECFSLQSHELADMWMWHTCVFSSGCFLKT